MVSDDPYQPVLSTNPWDLPTLDTSDPGPLKTSTSPHSISNLWRNPTLPVLTQRQRPLMPAIQVFNRGTMAKTKTVGTIPDHTLSIAPKAVTEDTKKQEPLVTMEVLVEKDQEYYLKRALDLCEERN